MKVVVAAGGRFHAVRLAQELAQRRMLHRFVSGSYSISDRGQIDARLVDSISSCQIIDQIIWRTRLASLISPSSLYVIKDNWFDSRLKKVIQRLDPFDIFVGWAHYFLGSVNELRKKTKIIITESGSCHIEEHERLIVEEYLRLGLPTAHLNNSNRSKILAEYAASDYIMTPSTFARASFLRKGFAPEKILQIPCGMDVEFFRADSTSQRPRNFFRLLFVGQLQIGKGIHTLLEAWRQLKISPSLGELLLVGNLQKDVRILLERHTLPSGVKIIPGVSRVVLKKLYASANAFVLPSLQDGFGMVLGEAMASGLPVIASTHTGGPDIIRNQSEGLLVAAGDTQALAHAIDTLYKNPDLCQALGTIGIQRCKDFSWNHYGNAIAKGYQTILEQHDNEKSKKPSHTPSGQIHF